MLTDERRARITRDANALYDYLVGIGFRVPTAMPLVGVSKSNTAYAVSQEPGSFVDHALFVPQNRLDTPNGIVPQYADWIFRALFPGFPGPETRFNVSVGWLYASYYVASFTNHYEIDTTSALADWKNGLWDLRAKYGQGIADKLLYYSYVSWYPPSKETKGFDDFFWIRFLAGLHAIDNNGHLTPDVLKIMHARGLPRRTASSPANALYPQTDIGRHAAWRLPISKLG